jgi:hypothetical protein
MKRNAQMSSDEESPEKKKQRFERPVPRVFSSTKRDELDQGRAGRLQQERHADAAKVKRDERDRKRREAAGVGVEHASRKTKETERLKRQKPASRREDDELENARRYLSQFEVEGQTPVGQDGGDDPEVIDVSKVSDNSGHQIDNTSLRMTKRARAIVRMRIATMGIATMKRLWRLILPLLL